MNIYSIRADDNSVPYSFAVPLPRYWYFTYAGVAYSAITVTTVFLIRVGIFVK
jgi:hypothetical protein